MESNKENAGNENQREWLLGFSSNGLLALCGASNKVTARFLPAKIEPKKGEAQVKLNQQVKESQKAATRSKQQKAQEARRKRATQEKALKRAQEEQKLKLQNQKQNVTNTQSQRPSSNVKMQDSVLTTSKQQLLGVQNAQEGPSEQTLARSRQTLMNAIQCVAFLRPEQKQVLLLQLSQKITPQQEIVLHQHLAEFLCAEQARFIARTNSRLHLQPFQQ